MKSNYTPPKIRELKAVAYYDPVNKRRKEGCVWRGSCAWSRLP